MNRRRTMGEKRRPYVLFSVCLRTGACDALVLLGRRRWQPIVDEKAYRTIIAGTFKPLFQPKNDYKENVVSYL